MNCGIFRPGPAGLFISFIAAVGYDGYEHKKLYPEGPVSARFKVAGTVKLCCFCNRHGLFEVQVKPKRK